MVKIILFNGPPRSGKDTIAKELEKHIDNYTTFIDKFADPIKKAIRDIYCNGDQSLFDYYDSPEQKDLVQDIFYGKSCRQLQIAFSENYMKPLHGNDIFIKILISKIKKEEDKTSSRNLDNLYLITDLGFDIELHKLKEEFGKTNIITLRMLRNGTTYLYDSRNYIMAPSSPFVINVDNNNTLEKTTQYILTELKEFLKED